MVKHRRVTSIAHPSFFSQGDSRLKPISRTFSSFAYTNNQIHKAQSTLPSPEHSLRYTSESDLELSCWNDKELRESHWPDVLPSPLLIKLLLLDTRVFVTRITTIPCTRIYHNSSSARERAKDTVCTAQSGKRSVEVKSHTERGKGATRSIKQDFGFLFSFYDL
jgi:hypothetical protein